MAEFKKMSAAVNPLASFSEIVAGTAKAARLSQIGKGAGVTEGPKITTFPPPGEAWDHGVSPAAPVLSVATITPANINVSENIVSWKTGRKLLEGWRYVVQVVVLGVNQRQLQGRSIL